MIRPEWFKSPSDFYWTSALQAAIDAAKINHLPVKLMPKEYQIDVPLMLYSGSVLEGESNHAGEVYSIIHKINNVVGSGTSHFTTGVTDDYAVDSIISVWHPTDDNAKQVTLSGVRLQGNSTKNAYGLFMPRANRVKVEDVFIENCLTGLLSHTIYMADLKNIEVWNPTVGIKLWHDGTYSGVGTSVNLERCVVVGESEFGIQLSGLSYSNLTRCVVQQSNPGTVIPTAYWIANSNSISMNSCATEYHDGIGLYLSGTVANVAAFKSLAPLSTLTGHTNSQLQVEGGKVVIMASAFDNYTSIADAANTYQKFINDGAQVTFINTTLPTNGNAWNGYTGGAKACFIDPSGFVIQP